MSKKMPDGSWGKAENMGPAINTAYNEDSPFIHPDGVTLFLSSEGHTSMGGYDIMFSTLSDGTWAVPINMGYPINTTEDELFYVLTADGEHGYYSSNRKGGYGQEDIYVVSHGFTGEQPVLALILGLVMGNEQPKTAKITITDEESGELIGTYHSNAVSGKYLFTLKPGGEYKVDIEMDGYDKQTQYVNGKSLNTYVQVKKDFKFYTEDYRKMHDVAAAKNTPKDLQKEIDQQIKQFAAEREAEVYEERIYKDLLKKFGDEKKDSVSYTVELGTFEVASDLDLKKYEEFGTIKTTKDAKGNTTYSLGTFKTLLDAEIFKYKVYGKDTSLNSAVVTVNDKGKRKLVQQYFRNEYTRKDYNAPTETQVVKAKLKPEPVLAVVTEEKKTPDPSNEKAPKPENKLAPKKEEPVTENKPVVKATEKKTQDIAVEKKRAVKPESVQTEGFEMKSENLCDPGAPTDFSYFVGKDLNNVEVYTKLINQAGGICAEGLVFRVQIGAYRSPENYKYKNLKGLEPPPALVLPYPDGITRFTMREFKILKDAEIFRQECIRRGTTDAWITALYQGKRMLLQDLIEKNFFNQKIN